MNSLQNFKFPKGSNHKKENQQGDLNRSSGSLNKSASSFHNSFGSFNKSASSFHNSFASFGESITSPVKKMSKKLLSPMIKKQNKSNRTDERDVTLKNFDDIKADVDMMLICKELEIIEFD